MSTPVHALSSLDEHTPEALRPVLQPLPALTDAGARLLDAASDLFHGRGVRAVGVDLIAEVAGTTKKTLYDRFGSKDALVALYLLRRAHRWRAHLLSHLDALDLSTDPVSARAQQVLCVFDILQDWMGRERRGCAFVNTFAELGDGEHPAVVIIRAEKAWMRALFDTLAGNHDVGGHLHLLYEGTLVVLTAGGDLSAVEQARRAAAGVLATGDQR